MARVLALVHIAERAERQKARAVAITSLALACLLASGAVPWRRRAAGGWLAAPQRLRYPPTVDQSDVYEAHGG